MPLGYRQGIVTAIAGFLAFSLAFIRYWGLEASGQWKRSDSVVATLPLASIGLQIYVLFRALDIKDENLSRYAMTVQWFLASNIILLAFGITLGILVQAQ